MAAELILLEDVKNLGTLGEKIRVADGYARNYLVPKGIAAPVTPATLQKLEEKKRQMEVAYAESLSAAQALAEHLNNESVTIPMEATEQDKLYGSVGPSQIVQALGEKDIHVDRDTVVLEDVIRELGVYEVTLQLHPEVTATLKVWVVRQ